MLSFGIFASGTPFFVMAGLYLFYMLINLGIHLNENPEQHDVAGADGKHVLQNLSSQSSEYNPAVYVVSAKDFKDYHANSLQISEDDKLALWPPPQNCRRCIKDKPDIEEYLLFSLFSRPPPVA